MTRIAVPLLFAVVAATAAADEGMWLPNDFPKKLVKEKHGFEPSDAWLEHVRLASVRLAGRGGCSGSFVSAQGLVLTNHHCAQSCIHQHSMPKRDLVALGFFAKTGADEKRCDGIEVDQLVGIEDV